MKNNIFRSAISLFCMNLQMQDKYSRIESWDELFRKCDSDRTSIAPKKKPSRHLPRWSKSPIVSCIPVVSRLFYWPTFSVMHCFIYESTKNIPEAIRASSFVDSQIIRWKSSNWHTPGYEVFPKPIPWSNLPVETRGRQLPWYWKITWWNYCCRRLGYQKMFSSFVSILTT